MRLIYFRVVKSLHGSQNAEIGFDGHGSDLCQKVSEKIFLNKYFRIYVRFSKFVYKPTLFKLSQK